MIPTFSIWALLWSGLLLGGGQEGGGQESPRAQPVDPILTGRLMLAEQPADTGTVVLHRVTPAEAGPVDSTQVQEGGRFEMRLPELPIPGSGEIYFVSSRNEGILYFGPPITEPGQLDSLYVVTQYPTRPSPSGGLAFTVEVRNLFIDQGPMGWRATDLFQVRNDSAFTWVSGREEHPVWVYPLPEGARSFRVGESDLAPDAVSFEGGALQVMSPMPPGERVFIIQYELESLEFALPLPGQTDVMELLVQEPAPALRVEGLRRAPPVEMEPGSTYLHWAGEELSNRVVRVEPGREDGVELLPLLAVSLALLLLGIGAWALRRTTPAGSWVTEGRSRDEILVAVARLDESFEAAGSPSDEDRARYEARRRELLATLEDARGVDRGRSGRAAGAPSTESPEGDRT